MLHSLQQSIAAVSVSTATDPERHSTGIAAVSPRLLVPVRLRLDELHPGDPEPRSPFGALGHRDLPAVRRDDLLTAHGLYAKLWGVQAGEIEELPEAVVDRARERHVGRAVERAIDQEAAESETLDD